MPTEDTQPPQRPEYRGQQTSRVAPRESLPANRRGLPDQFTLDEFERVILSNFEANSGRKLSQAQRAWVIDRIDLAVDRKGEGKATKADDEFLTKSGYTTEAKRVWDSMSDEARPDFLELLNERRGAEPLDRVNRAYPESKATPRQLRPAERRELDIAASNRSARRADPDTGQSEAYRRYENVPVSRNAPRSLRANAPVDMGDLPNVVAGYTQNEDGSLKEIAPETQRRAEHIGAKSEIDRVSSQEAQRLRPSQLGPGWDTEARTNKAFHAPMRKASMRAEWSQPAAADYLWENYGVDPRRNWGDVQYVYKDIQQDRDFRAILNDLSNKSSRRRENTIKNMTGTGEFEFYPRDSEDPYMTDRAHFGDPDSDYQTRHLIPSRGEFEPMDRMPGSAESRGASQRAIDEVRTRGIQGIQSRVMKLLQDGNVDEARMLAVQASVLLAQVNDDEGDREFIGTVTNQDRFRQPDSGGESLMRPAGPPLGEIARQNIGPNGMVQANAFEEMMSRYDNDIGFKKPYIDRIEQDFGDASSWSEAPRWKRPSDPRLPDPGSLMGDATDPRWAELDEMLRPTDFYENEGAPEVNPRGMRPEPPYQATRRAIQQRPVAGPPGSYQGRMLTEDISPVMPSSDEMWDINNPAARPVANPDNIRTSPNAQIPVMQGRREAAASRMDARALTRGILPSGDTRGFSLGSGLGEGLNPILEMLQGVGTRALPMAGKGLGALGLAGDILDSGEMSGFHSYLQQQGMDQDPAALTMNAMGSIPLLGPLLFNRQRFQDDPTYRQSFMEPLAIS